MFYCFAVSYDDDIYDTGTHRKYVIPMVNQNLFQGTLIECKNHVFSEIKEYFDDTSSGVDYSNYSPGNINDIQKEDIIFQMYLEKEESQRDDENENENLVIKIPLENKKKINRIKINPMKMNNDTISGCLLGYCTNGGLHLAITYIAIPIEDFDNLTKIKINTMNNQNINNIENYYLLPIEPDDFNFEPDCEYKYPLKLFNTKKFFTGTKKECTEQFYSDLIEYFDYKTPNNMNLMNIQNGFIDLMDNNDDVDNDISCFAPIGIEDIKYDDIKCNITVRRKNLIIKDCQYVFTPTNDSIGVLGYGTSGGMCTSLYYFIVPTNHPSMTQIIGQFNLYNTKNN